MKGERPARLLLPPSGARAPRRDGGARRSVSAAGRASVPDDPIAAAAAEPLFEALRRHRLGLARAEGIAPFMVASDRTLRDVALLKPRTLDDLLLVHGIGRHKAERYGAGLLEVVAQHG